MSQGAKQTTREICEPVLVRVRERGQFTIPAEIRRQMGIEEGDVFSLVRLGDTLVATRKKLVAPKIARVIEALLEEEGVTLGDLLGGLEKQRKAYLRDKYGLED